MITDDLAITDLLRCVEDEAGGERGLGTLHGTGEALTCEACGARYPIVRGVPVLKPGAGRELISARGDDGWFEAMYAGRSRLEELETEYLRAERAFLARLVRD